MHTRRLAAALLSLISLQIVGSLSFIASDVRAQSNELVAVMSLYTGRDVCEVQFRKSDNDQWGEESREGPPIACPGGIVVTEILTQEEANQIASASEDGLMSGPNAGTDPVEVRVVVLSGDASADDEAIQGEISNLHETAAAESGSLPVDQAQFMAPEVLDAFLPTQPELGAAALAADCRQGRVGQERRADFAWNQKRIGVTVKAYLYYKRVSCANWKIRRIESRLLANNYPLRIWLRDVEYTKIWSAAQSRYVQDSYWLDCPEVFEGRWTTVSPSILIQANGNAQIESIDTNPHTPSRDASCKWGAGTSATSVWTYLPGGTR